MFVVCLFIYSMLYNMHVSPNIQINTLFETELTVCDNFQAMNMIVVTMHSARIFLPTDLST